MDISELALLGWYSTWLTKDAIIPVGTYFIGIFIVFDFLEFKQFLFKPFLYLELLFCLTYVVQNWYVLSNSLTLDFSIAFSYPIF